MLSIIILLCLINGFNSILVVHDDNFVGVNRMAYNCMSDVRSNYYRGTCDPLGHLNNTFPRYKYKTIVNHTSMELRIQAYAESTVTNTTMPKFFCEIDGWVTPTKVNIKCVSRNGKKIVYCIGNNERSTCVQTR